MNEESFSAEASLDFCATVRPASPMLRNGWNCSDVSIVDQPIGARTNLVLLYEADNREAFRRLDLGDVELGLADVHRRAAVLITLCEGFKLHIPLASRSF